MTGPGQNSDSELTVLLVEDDDGHAALIRRRLKRLGVGRRLVRFADGSEILEYLFGDEADAAHWQPNERYAMLLDINLPKINGIEVLRRVRQSPQMEALTVIMLTTTDDPQDMSTCKRLGCDEYVVKPVGAASFAEAVLAIGAMLEDREVARA